MKTKKNLNNHKTGLKCASQSQNSPQSLQGCSNLHTAHIHTAQDSNFETAEGEGSALEF